MSVLKRTGMERLTKRDIENGIEVVDISDSLFKGLKSHKISAIEIDSKILHKLAEYEDLEEQGRLLKLPCKVGDVVYCTDDKCITIFTAYNFRIFPLQRFACSCEGKMVNFEQFGKTAFLSLDKAEARLKELRGGENGTVEL